MHWLKKEWNERYLPTEAQRQIIADVCSGDDHELRDAIIATAGHLYAEGWKDWMLPFMGVGLVLGIYIGRRLPF